MYLLGHIFYLMMKNANLVKYYAELLLFYIFTLFILFSVLSYNEFVRGVIEGFLSSVTLWVFFAVLPLVSIYVWVIDQV